jgi:hypothetical protein
MPIVKETGKEEEPYLTTYLFIERAEGDQGTNPLPPEFPAWCSPAIITIRPDGVPSYEIIVNQTNIIRVEVTNRGQMDASDAYVEVFCVDPNTCCTPNTATRLGGNFLSIPSYSKAATEIRWKPPSSNKGHHCLFARVCLGVPPDCFRDGSIFDVVNDRHVAQRNIEIVELNDNTENFSYGFMVGNPNKVKGSYSIRVTQLMQPKQTDILKAGLKWPTIAVSKLPLQASRFSISDVSKNAIVDRADYIKKTKQLLKGPLIEKPRSLTPNVNTFDLEKGEIKHAVVNIAPNARWKRGEFIPINVEQIDNKTGHVVGGLTILVKLK